MFGADKGQHFNRKQIEFIYHGNREALPGEIANVTGSAFLSKNPPPDHDVKHLLLCWGGDGVVSQTREEGGRGRGAKSSLDSIN